MESLHTQNHFVEKASFRVLVGALFFVAFIFLPTGAIPLVSTKACAVLVGGLVLLGVYISNRLRRGNMVIPSTGLLALLWLPAIAYLVSTVLSRRSMELSLWGTTFDTDSLAFIATLSLFGTLTALILRKTEHYSSLFSSLRMIFVGLVGLSIVAMGIGKVFPYFISPDFSPAGSFSDLAILLGCGVILSLLAERFVEGSLLMKRVLGVTGVLSLFIIFLADVPFILILVAIVSLGLFVESVLRQKPSGYESDLEGVSVVSEAPITSYGVHTSLMYPLIALVLTIFFFSGSSLRTQLENTLNIHNGSVIDTTWHWTSTLDTARQSFSFHNLLGEGPGSFGYEWLLHRDVRLNTSPIWNIDFTSGVGFIPTSLVSVGVVGFIAWCILFGGFVLLGLRALLVRAPEDPHARFAAIASYVAALYLIIAASVAVPGPIPLLFLFVCMGVFISTLRLFEGGAQWGILFARSPRIGFVVVFSLTLLLLTSTVGAYHLVARYMALAYAAQAQTDVMQGHVESAKKNIARSLSLSPSVRTQEIAADIELMNINTIVASSTVTSSVASRLYQDALSSGVAAAREATHTDPTDYRAWLLLGTLYAKAVPLNINGAYEQAIKSYEEAKKLNPTNAEIPFAMAQLSLAKKDSASAETYLKEALDLKQNHAAAVFLLSQIQASNGKLDDALNSALAAAYFVPNDPNILFQVGVLYVAKHDMPHAQQALEAAVAANPSYADAHYLLAAVYSRQKEFEKAIEHIDSVASLSKENSSLVSEEKALLQQGKDPFANKTLTPFGN